MTILINLLCFFGILSAKMSDVDAFLGTVLSSSAIVNREQIKIPGYPNAYNPSLIPYKDGYLLSFRYISKCPEKFQMSFHTDVSFVGVARLDKNFKVLKRTVQLLNILSYSPQFSLTAEDARLVNVGNRMFIVFNDLSLLQTPESYAMYFGELIEEKGLFALKEPAKPLHYCQAIRVEKNWSPFSVGDRLYLIYSDQPRVILEVDLNTGHCHEAAREDGNTHWNLGTIRGGTPAHLAGDAFLTFFHSCFPAKTSKGKVYVMGAYTFDKEPPFAIRTMTSRPLGDLADYTQENATKVVFPGGMVVEGNRIHVAWGKADKQIWITTFDREKLLASMEPCCN